MRTRKGLYEEKKDGKSGEEGGGDFMDCTPPNFCLETKKKVKFLHPTP